MGKRKLTYFCGILFALLLCIAKMNVSAAENLEIEQVQAIMPEVKIYLRSDDTLLIEELEIWLGEEKLEIDSIMNFSDSDISTDYFILVDVSNSMPDAYCANIIEALIDFSENLNSNEKLVLLAFGEDVTTLLDGAEDKAAHEEAIRKLHNTDKKTLLFEAIQKTADMADRMQDDARKIVLVISDGENFAKGASTSAEAEKSMSERNLPVYAMGIADTDKENLNQFGETARTLGGTLTVFTAEETAASLKNLKELWKNTQVIQCLASSNRINNRLNNLSLRQTASGLIRNRQVMLSAYQPDLIPPEIVAVEKTGERQLTVSFNKAVTGCENNVAWSIIYDNNTLPVITASYDGKTDNRVVLTFEKELYTGIYQISAPGVTDISMDKNKSSNTWELELEGVTPETEEELPLWQQLLKDWLWLVLLLLFLVMAVIILTVWHNIKKNKGIVYINGKASLVNNVDSRQRISIEKTEGFPIQIDLIGEVDAERKQIQISINGSIIVGRASICELSFDDDKMSRQHFALEYRDNNVYITDLNTTNGTKVNGVVIHKTFKLNPRDVIEAGSLQMRITW